MITHGSLFSGIGGFDLAAEWMGWENKFHCEINTFGRKVLKHYWPNATSYEDITKTDFTIWRNRIDVVSGGFPCQPYSVAGQRKGTEDDRHLWPEMLRTIGEIQPSWVVGENVPGLISWNGGLVLKQIKTDLESKGFEVFPPLIIPACGKDAPHRRDRLWIVAHSSIIRCNTRRPKQSLQGDITSNTAQEFNTHPNDKGLEGCKEARNIGSSGKNSNEQFRRYTELNAADTTYTNDQKHYDRPGEMQYRRSSWSEHWFEAATRLCVLDDGLPGRLDGITLSKWRTESLKAAGNSVVPQVVYEIFKAIESVI